MGRAPCCDKTKVKRGPWSPEEDATLKTYIENHGTGGNWICLPQKAGLKRCGKSCRLRWLNYLRPDIKHGHFSDEEDFIICTLYNRIGSRWSVIASKLEGRTDNDVKNHWNTKLKKKYLIMAESISSMSSSGMVSPGTTFIDIGINNSYPSITSYDLNNFTAMTPTPSTNYYHLDYNDHLMNDITNNVTPKLEYVEPYYPHNYLSAAAAAACTEGGGSSDLSGDNVIGAIVSENYDMNGMMSNNNVMDGYYFSGFGFGNSTGSSTSNHHSDYHGHDHDHDHVVGTRNWCESVEDHRSFEAVNVDGYGTNYYDDDYNNIGSGGDRSMWECMGN